MLKFSGFAGLTSCLGEARSYIARLTQGLLPTGRAKRHRAAMALDTLLPQEKRTRYAACAKGVTHLDTQAYAVTPPQQDLRGKITGRRERRL